MGAKKKNTNALKDGIYSRHFTATEIHSLGKMSPRESEHEIHMLRASIDRLLSLIEECEDEDRRIKLYNALFLATRQLSNAMRTEAIVSGDSKELLVSFWKAIEAFRKEKGV